MEENKVRLASGELRKQHNVKENDIAFELFGGTGEEGDNLIEEFKEKLTKDGIAKSSKQIVDNIANSFGEEVIEPPLPIYSLAHLLITNTWHSKCVYKLRDVATKQGWFISSEEESSDVSKVEEFIKNFTKHEDNCGLEGSLEDLLGNIVIDLRAFGNAYIEVIRDMSGKPVEFYHVPALTVRKAKQTERLINGGFYQFSNLMTKSSYSEWYGMPRTNNKYSSKNYRIFSGGTFYKMFFKNYGDMNVYDIEGNQKSGLDIDEQANEIIHIKDYHPLSPFYGIPSYISSFDAMLSDEAAEKWNLSFFKNNRIPRWLIVISGKDFTDKEKRNFESYFANILRGRPHIPTVLSTSNSNAKVTIHKLESDINEASFLELRKASRDEIIASHDTPPRMVGIISTGVLGGKGDSQKQREDYKNFTVIPTQKKITSWINDLILPDNDFNGYKLELKSFDVEDSEEKEKKSKAVSNLVSKGVMSINEARKVMGLKPIDEDFAEKFFMVHNDTVFSFTDGVLLTKENKDESSQEDNEDIKDKTGGKDIKKAIEQFKKILENV